MREEIIDNRKEDSELRDLAKSMGAATGLSSSENKTKTVSKKRPKKPKSSRIYPCPQQGCKSTFNRTFTLTRHLQEKHSNIELFRCYYDDCKKKYMHERNLKRHIESSHFNRRFSCTDCSIKYTSNQHLSKHMLKEHKLSPAGHSLDSSSSASSPMPSTSTQTPVAISEVGTHPFKRFHQDCSDIHSPSSPIIALSPSSPVSPLPPFTSSLNSSFPTDSSSTSYIPSTPTPELPIIKHPTLTDEVSSLFDFENINTQTPQLPIVSPITDSSKLPESLSKKRKKPAHLARNNRYSNRYSIVNSFSQPNTRDTVIQMESLERSSKVSKLNT